MCARRFATGLRGVVVRLLRLLSRSRSELEETVRLADVKTFRTSIAPGSACYWMRARVRRPVV